MEKKGSGFITSMIVGILALFMFMALTPSIVQMVGMSKGSDSLNCPGYTDPNEANLGANNHSYNSNLDTNTLGCTVADFTPGLLILGIVFAVIMGIIAGKLGESQPQPYGYAMPTQY